MATIMACVPSSEGNGWMRRWHGRMAFPASRSRSTERGSPAGRRSRGSLSPRIRRPRSHALARDDAGDRAEHRDPVVAARVDRAAARPRRNAADREPVRLRLDVDADRRAAPSVTVSIRSVSFARSSSAPFTYGRAVRERARAAPRAAARRRGAAPPRARPASRRAACERTSRSATGSPADLPPVVDADARAHPLEHVEQAGARRADVDALDHELRAGEQRRRR